MLWKGSQVQQEDDEEAVTINQGIGDIRFTNILQLFSLYFFFSITLLSHFFYTFFHPRHLPTPTPTPTTHALYPRPTTNDPRHLATLVIFWGLISIATLRLRCHDLIYRCLCANPNLSWNTINRTHSYMYFWALFLNKRVAASSSKGCAFAGIAIVQQQNRKKKNNVKLGKYYNVPLACSFFTLVPRLTLYLFIRTGWKTTKRSWT